MNAVTRPIDAVEQITELVGLTVINFGTISRPYFTGDYTELPFLSKTLRQATGYPRVSRPESWVIRIFNPRGKTFPVDSVFYGDNRLETALRLYGIRFQSDDRHIWTGPSSYALPEPRRGETPRNIVVKHGSFSVHPQSSEKRIDQIAKSVTREWDVVVSAYEPRPLSDLDLRQSELALEVINKIQREGDPTLYLNELFVVTPQRFKLNLTDLMRYGGRVHEIAAGALHEFERIERDLGEKGSLAERAS